MVTWRQVSTPLLSALLLAGSSFALQRATTTQATTAPATATGPHWPMFRGDPHLTGVAGCELPERLSLRWRSELGEATSSTAAIVDGTVFIGADDGTLSAIGLRDGQRLWKHKGLEPIRSSPTVVKNLVIFGDEAGLLRACAVQTGKLRWTFQCEDRIVSSVNLCNDRLVFGSYDSNLYCLNVADGKLLWKVDAGERIHGTPGISHGHVLASACDGHLHVVRLSDGSVVRKVPLGSVSASAVATCGGQAYLGLYDSQIIGVDWRAGRVLWRFEDPDRAFPYMASAAVTDDLVIIGGRDKRLRALDRQTGRQRWQFVTRGRVDSSPVVVGDRVFVGSEDGNLYAVDRKTGRQRWRFEAGGPISASPAVGEGHLVIGTEDGVVYCFGPRKTD